MELRKKFLAWNTACFIFLKRKATTFPPAGSSPSGVLSGKGYVTNEASPVGLYQSRATGLTTAIGGPLVVVQ